MVRRLASEEWFEVKDAVEKLGRLGDQRAVLPVSQILDHEMASVREAAVRALESIGGPEALAMTDRFRELERRRTRRAKAGSSSTDFARVDAVKQARKQAEWEAQQREAREARRRKLDRVIEGVRPRLLARLKADYAEYLVSAIERAWFEEAAREPCPKCGSTRSRLEWYENQPGESSFQWLCCGCLHHWSRLD